MVAAPRERPGRHADADRRRRVQRSAAPTTCRRRPTSSTCARSWRRTTPPKLADAPGGAHYVDHRRLNRGQRGVRTTCAGCHSNGEARDARSSRTTRSIRRREIGTNRCRSLATNWTAGHIWAEFSSDQYKARPTGGPGFYRDVPLLGVWATAPFFHNNRLGAVQRRSVASRAASPRTRTRWTSCSIRGSATSSARSSTTSDAIQLGRAATLPAGTPVALFANAESGEPARTTAAPTSSRTRATTSARCSPTSDKHALTEYLKTK